MDLFAHLPKDKEIVIVTHSGSFHTDEIFAVATLSLVLDSLGYIHRVIRTRDEEVIKAADIVCDVGGIFDVSTLRFDHHQKDAPLPRNDYPYSSFGLVWKYFGMYLCAENKEIWNVIEEHVSYPIDAYDNGVELYTLKSDKTHPFLFHDVVFAFRPLKEERRHGETGDSAFDDFVQIARKYITRRIEIEKEIIEDKKKAIEAYELASNKQVIILTEDISWYEAYANFKEPLFVVTPKIDERGVTTWRVEAVREDVGSFANRKSLPLSWRGASGNELEKITGVSGALFCHRAGFLLTALSLESAVSLAHLALSNT